MTRQLSKSLSYTALLIIIGNLCILCAQGRLSANIFAEKDPSEGEVLTTSNSSNNVTMNLSGNDGADEQPDDDDEFIIFFEQGFYIMDDETVAHLVKDVSEKYTIQPKEIYTGMFPGFTASNVTKDDVEYLKGEEGVLLVEKDVTLTLNVSGEALDEESSKSEDEDEDLFALSNSNCPGSPPWGIQRVGGFKDMTHSKKRAFIIDSGVAPLDSLNIQTEYARNFLTNFASHQWEDTYGHGTHVAGIIGARDFWCNMVGVAAGVPIVPIRVLDGYGRGKLSWMLSAINYVATIASPGDVVNFSLVARIEQRSLDIAVTNLANTGVYVTTAAGNDGAHAALYTPGRASASHPNIYTVSAIDNTDNMYVWSNYGSPPIDYAAPGVDIISLATNGKRKKMTGTSMAAPHVAGLLLIGDGVIRTDGFSRNDWDDDADQENEPIAHY